jgi:hypothetical protein
VVSTPLDHRTARSTTDCCFSGVAQDRLAQ